MSLYEKKKDTKDTGFMDALRKSAEEAFAQRRAGFIETPEKTIPAKKEYSYTVTEEQAEYFREKYGEDFDDETVGRLFDELHLKGIMSDKDSRYASGKSWAYTIGLFDEYGTNIMDGANSAGLPDKYSKIITKDKYGNTVVTFPSKINYDDFQFYDDYEYKNAYKRFEYEYDKEVTTWKDYLEKRLAFVEYLRSCDRSKMSDFLDDSGNLWLTDKMLDDMEDNIRKAAEVIDQIFGRQESSPAEKVQSEDETVGENEPTYSLTEKQLYDLALKYDLDKIKPGSQREQDFLNELAEMGIISNEDASLLFFNCGFIQTDEFPFSSVVPMDEADSSIFSSCYVPPASDNIIDRLIAIIETQKNISEYYKSQGDDFASERSEDFTNSKQKLLDILQSITEKAASIKVPVYSFVYTLDENGNVIRSAEDIEAMRRYEAVREAIKNGEVIDLSEKIKQQMEEANFHQNNQPRDDLTIITKEQLKNILETNYKPEMKLDNYGAGNSILSKAWNKFK